MQTHTKSEAAPASGIVRNMAWLAWSGAINIANSIVIWVAMAHWREASEVGRFSTVMSVYTIFMTLCSLGLSPYLASEIARRKERGSFVASAIFLIGGWSLVSAAAMVATGYAVSQSPPARLATWILCLAMLPTGLIGVAEAVFIALGRARVIAVATTTENLLRTIIPIYLLYRGHTLPVICLSFVVVRLSACVAYAIVARSWLSAWRRASRPVMMQIAKVAPTFAGVTILATVHWQIGALLVNRFSGETEAAKFGVAFRFLIPVTLLLWSYVSVLQPAASRLAAESLAKLGDFLSRALRLVIALGLPLAVGGMLLSRELLVVLFGARYAGASVALGLLGLSVIPFSIIMIASRGLIATGRQRLDLLANLAAVVSNVAANAILIPRYGASGAAAAQLLSVTAMAAVEVGYGTRPLFQLNVWQAIWTCRWPLAAITTVIWLAKGLGFWQALILGGASYLIGLMLIWERVRPTPGNLPAPGNLNEGQARPRARVLMVGAHLTRTLGGISTIMREILQSPLANEFEFRHIASQADECGKFGKLALAVFALIKFGVTLVVWRPGVAYIHVGSNASLYRKIPFIALARMLRRSVIVHFHAGDFDFYYGRQPWLGRELISHGLGLSHRLITVSECLGQRLRELLPAAEISVVPIGIKTAIFAANPEESVKMSGKMGGTGSQPVPPAVGQVENLSHIRLLFVGAMGRLKGERDLIHALEHLEPALRVTLRATLLGHGAEAVRPFFQASGAWPLIEHLGPVTLEERVEFFKRADLFVLPTYAEGMPVSVLEAMAAGLPVISTRVGGVPELIEDGVEGYLVAPGDIESLADRIARLLRNPSEGRRMGERGQVKARDFDEKLIFARLGAQLRLATDRRLRSAGREAASLTQLNDYK